MNVSYISRIYICIYIRARVDVCIYIYTRIKMNERYSTFKRSKKISRDVETDETFL